MGTLKLKSLKERFDRMTAGQKAVTIFTYLISPPTIFAGLGFSVAWLASRRPEFSPQIGQSDWFEWGLAYNALIIFIPFLFLVWMVLRGSITTLSMTRSERHIPYVVACSTTVVTWWVLKMAGAPPMLLLLCLVTALGLVGLFLVNLWWKISNHATASMSAAVLWGFLHNWTTGTFLVGVAVLVCAGRLYLKKHTPMQLVIGALWGAVSVALLVAMMEL